MKQEQRVLVFTGAGFSKALTEDSSVPLPVSNEFLADPHFSDHVSSDAARITLQLGLNNKETSYLSQVLHMDFLAQFVHPDFEGEKIQSNKVWLDPASNEPINFEILYAYCELQQRSPLIGPINQNRYRAALYELQMLMAATLDVRNSETKMDTILFGRFLTKLGYTSDYLPVPLFVTTNYDNLLEDYSFDRSKDSSSLPSDFSGSASGRSYGGPNIDDYFTAKISPFGGPILIKLHGGVNYFICANKGCRWSDGPHYQNNVIPIKDACPACGAQTIPGVLPPTTVKDYSSSAYYTKWLNHLVVATSETTHLVIVGYSFPQYDALLTAWISIGLRKNQTIQRISIIDKKPQRVLKLMRTIHPKLGDQVKPYCSLGEFVENGEV